MNAVAKRLRPKCTFHPVHPRRAKTRLFPWASQVRATQADLRSVEDD
jgi:hypothetical protein